MVLERGVPLDTEGAEPMPRGGIIASAAMHIGIFVLIIVGLPTFFRPQIPDDQPIAVELVTIAPETHATKLNPNTPRPNAKPDTPVNAAPAPVPIPKPTPPPPTPAAPPSATPPPPAPPAQHRAARPRRRRLRRRPSRPRRRPRHRRRPSPSRRRPRPRPSRRNRRRPTRSPTPTRRTPRPLIRC